MSQIKSNQKVQNSIQIKSNQKVQNSIRIKSGFDFCPPLEIIRMSMFLTRIKVCPIQ